MKQNVIMIVILIALFVFGLLIYDFSDELDKSITSHNWYIYENNDISVMSFKNNEFTYYQLGSKKDISDYDLCTTYRYNRSINVIKLNCSVIGNKIYIASYDKNTLKITIDGKEKVLYRSEELAKEDEFKKANNLTEEEYEQLINKDILKYNSNTIDEIITLYKSKTTKYVAFINSNITYHNALNYKALDNIISKTDKVIVTITTDDLSLIEAQKLHEISDVFSEKATDYVSDEIRIYQIGNKKVKLIDTINVKNILDASNYNIDLKD